MGAKENVKLVQDMIAANRARDEERYLSFFTDDVTFRAAGVPRALGGVQGKDQVRENFRSAQPSGEGPTIRNVFADDSHVCLEERVTANFSGTRFFKGSGKPYTTYQCVVYEIAGGKIKSSTAYINFLDVYVQAGMVDLSKLTA